MASNMFLIIPEIEGDSQVIPNAMELLSYSWGASNAANRHTLTGGGGPQISVQDISIVKSVDKATPNLLHFLVTHKDIPEAKLVLRKAAGDDHIDYYTVVMKEVVIAHYSVSSGGDLATESVVLNFRKYETVYIGQEPDQSASPEVTKKFDIAASKEE
jgi:type VI secretion system secreted protein Hcp